MLDDPVLASGRARAAHRRPRAGGQPHAAPLRAPPADDRLTCRRARWSVRQAPLRAGQAESRITSSGAKITGRRGGRRRAGPASAHRRGAGHRDDRVDHGGQRGSGRRRDAEVVEPDHGDVARDGPCRARRARCSAPAAIRSEAMKMRVDVRVPVEQLARPRRRRRRHREVAARRPRRPAGRPRAARRASR